MTRVVTGKVRLSFPHLFEPYAITDEQDPRYSTMILLPKSDKTTYEALRKAEKEAAELGKAKFGGRVPAKVASIIKDGDEDGTAEDYPERAGHYYMTVGANIDYQPEVVDRALNPIISRNEVYSGVYARVSLTAFAYNTAGNKGVSFGLNNVQIIGGGDPLGNRKRAEDEFDALSDEDADLI